MALVVYGFPTRVQALQFEWAWQHPEKSKAVREVVRALKKHQKYGTAGKVGAAANKAGPLARCCCRLLAASPRYWQAGQIT